MRRTKQDQGSNIIKRRAVGFFFFGWIYKEKRGREKRDDDEAKNGRAADARWVGREAQFSSFLLSFYFTFLSFSMSTIQQSVY